MNLTRKILAIFLTIVLGMILTLVVIGLPFSTTLLKPGFIEAQFQDNDLYAQLPDVVTSTVYQSLQELPGDQYSAFLQLLSEEQVKILVNKLLPEEWFKQQVDKIVNSFTEFLNLKTQQINLEVDLTPLKQNINSENGLSAITGILATYPPCSLEYLLTMFSFAGQGNFDSMTICNPPEEFQALLQPFFVQMLKAASMGIPSEIEVPVYVGPANAGDTRFEKAYSAYQFIYKTGKLIPWICAGIVLLIILLVLPQFRTLLRFLGGALLAAGALGGLGLLGALRIGNGFVAGLPSSGVIPDFLESLSTLIVQTGQSILSAIQQQTLLVSGIAAGAGLFLVLISGLFKQRT